jgi:hypothetical protein
MTPQYQDFLKISLAISQVHLDTERQTDRQTAVAFLIDALLQPSVSNAQKTGLGTTPILT